MFGKQNRWNFLLNDDYPIIGEPPVVDFLVVNRTVDGTLLMVSAAIPIALAVDS